MLIPAHAGGWLSAAVFAVPVVMLGGMMLVDRIRNRRNKRRETPPPKANDPTE